MDFAMATFARGSTQGLPEELRLRRRMFRERLRKGLLETSRKRLCKALDEGL
jgi:hypothetical protein